MTLALCQELKDHLDIRYQALMDFADFGLILVDLSGNIVDVNRAALNMLGSPGKEHTMAINMLSYPPLEHAGVSAVIRDAITGSTKIERILTYVSKWGSVLRMKATACAVRDAKNEPCLVAFMMSDITELENTKDRLDKIVKVLIKTVDGITSHFITCKNTHGQYQVVNKAYADFFGVRIQDIIGKTDEDLWDAEYAQKIRMDDLEVLSTCGNKETEDCVTHPDHGSRRFRLIRSAICSNDDVGELVVSVIEDITEDYHKQQVAARAIKDLEKFIHNG